MDRKRKENWHTKQNLREATNLDIIKMKVFYLLILFLNKKKFFLLFFFPNNFFVYLISFFEIFF